MLQNERILKKMNRIQSKITKDLRKYILLVFFAFACLQRIVIFNYISALKPVHIIGALMIPLFILYKSKHQVNTYVCFFVLMLYVQTGIAYFKYGFNTWVLNLFFDTLVVFLVWWLSDDFILGDWMWIGEKTSIFFFICVLVNSFIQADSFWNFLIAPHVGHPEYISFLGGGPNLDASWLGLFTFLCAASPWWPPMLAVTLFFSILVSSRAGLLAGIAFLVWAVAQWIRKSTKKDTSIRFLCDWSPKVRLISIILTMLTIATFLILQVAAFVVQYQKNQNLNLANENEVKYYGTIENIRDRFENIGTEPGSRGRLNMWKWVSKESQEEIWGYGLGNGIGKVKENDPKILEDNLHNIYLQVLLDQGIIGIVALIVLCFMFVRREFPTLAANPLSGFILCYLSLGMVQFRFLDIPFWFVVGAYMSLAEAQKRE